MYATSEMGYPAMAMLYVPVLYRMYVCTDMVRGYAYVPYSYVCQCHGMSQSGTVICMLQYVMFLYDHVMIHVCM